MDSEIDVLVLGAGVVGLTTALRALEAGYTTRVVARDLPDQTISATAGAFWGPFYSSHERTSRWSAETFALLQQQAEIPETGVRLVPGLEAARTPVPVPEWIARIEDFAYCPDDRLPPGFVTGWEYTVPVLDMPVYMAWLAARLAGHGVQVEVRTVRSLAEPGLAAAVVVNCTGVGARDLVPDDSLVPVRGQLVVVENPGIERFFADHDDDPDTLTYILPQGDQVILGGSIAEHDMDPLVDQGIAAAIIERCEGVEPRLAGARVLGHRVGWRPGRPQIRVEAEELDRRYLIHNYGHGGSGISVAWGCAAEVVSMIEGFAAGRP